MTGMTPLGYVGQWVTTGRYESNQILLLNVLNWVYLGYNLQKKIQSFFVNEKINLYNIVSYSQ